MKLILIYGPPATGKLTVAQELAKITGYKIFHNQLTVDLILSIFKFGTDTFFKLNHKFRMAMFEAAAKEKIDGLIFTFCYNHPDDQKFIRKVKAKVEKHKGKLHFVHLYCSKQQLLKRVKHASRENFDKLRSIKELKKCLEKYEFFTKIPFVRNLVIDNTKVSARKAAKMIKEHYRLSNL